MIKLSRVFSIASPGRRVCRLPLCIASEWATRHLRMNSCCLQAKRYEYSLLRFATPRYRIGPSREGVLKDDLQTS
jgi:hypothetical protein